MARHRILIEGYTKDELIAFEGLEALAVTGEPIVFQVGKAEVLGQFSQTLDVLTAELSVVDGGGEGVLIELIDAVELWSRSKGIAAIEWVIYATDCAEPNPKLIRALKRLGFSVRRLDNGAECFLRRVSTNDTLLRRHSS